MDAKAPSPFLPGTKIQYAWDSTSLGTLKTCPRLYQYIMLDGWSSEGESIHLRFGQEVHTAFQEYDLLRADGSDHDEALRQVIANLLTRTHGWEVDEDTKAGKYKNRRSLVRVVIDHLDQVKDDPAQTFIMQDGRPAVELSFRFELDWGPEANNRQHGSSIDGEGAGGHPYLLCGHLDRVVDYLGDLYVMDYKTTLTTPGPYFFAQYSPNNQMSLYTLASKVMLDTPAKGVIINAIQILVEETRVVRGMTYRTPDQLEEWLADLKHWLTLAEHYATIGHWPMNDQSCSNYGGCRFREVCSKSPAVREKFLRSDFVQLPPEQRWNPLRSR